MVGDLQHQPASWQRQFPSALSDSGPKNLAVIRWVQLQMSVAGIIGLPYIPYILTVQMGLSSEAYGFVIGLNSLVHTYFGVIYGRLSDAFGRRSIMFSQELLTVLCLGVMGWSLSFDSSSIIPAVVLILYGACNVYQAILQAAVCDMYECDVLSHPEARRLEDDRTIAIAYVAGYAALGEALGPLLGQLLQQTVKTIHSITGNRIIMGNPEIVANGKVQFLAGSIVAAACFFFTMKFFPSTQSNEELKSNRALLKNSILWVSEKDEESAAQRPRNVIIWYKNPALSIQVCNFCVCLALSAVTVTHSMLLTLALSSPEIHAAGFPTPSAALAGMAVAGGGVICIVLLYGSRLAIRLGGRTENVMRAGSSLMVVGSFCMVITTSILWNCTKKYSHGIPVAKGVVFIGLLVHFVALVLLFFLGAALCMSPLASMMASAVQAMSTSARCFLFEDVSKACQGYGQGLIASSRALASVFGPPLFGKILNIQDTTQWVLSEAPKIVDHSLTTAVQPFAASKTAINIIQRRVLAEASSEILGSAAAQFTSKLSPLRMNTVNAAVPLMIAVVLAAVPLILWRKCSVPTN